MKKRYIPIIGGVCCLLLVGGILIGMNLNKNSKSNKNKTNDDPRYKIYLKAVDAGYEGTYEDWLLSIRGDEVELRVADNYIQMKYKQSTLWSNLISLDLLKGTKGDNGNDGVSIKSQLQVNDGYIQYKNENETTWYNLIAISDLTGAKGEKIELNVDNGFINYKYESDADWTELIELSTLTGNNGKEVIMSVESDYIVWKYTGDSSWTNLVSIDTLKGSQGDKGDKGEKSLMQVSDGFIQWKNENDTSWTNLISIETITGNNGKEITLSTDSNYIVWKYVGEDTWNNLVSLETLKGDNGNDGEKSLMRVADGYIQWKNESDTTWNNLIAIDDLKGNDGSNGRGVESCEIVDGCLIINYTDGTSENVGTIYDATSSDGLLEYILLSDDTYGVRQKYASGDLLTVTSITIPETFNEKAVTQILAGGFSNCPYLQKVFMPNTITIIGDSAFEGCSALDEIEFKEGLVRIGRCAFYDCSSLKSIVIPNTTNFIGQNAFYGTTLTSATMTGSWDLSSPDLTDLLVIRDTSVPQNVENNIITKYLAGSCFINSITYQTTGNTEYDVYYSSYSYDYNDSSLCASALKGTVVITPQLKKVHWYRGAEQWIDTTTYITGKITLEMKYHISDWVKQ